MKNASCSGDVLTAALERNGEDGTATDVAGGGGKFACFLGGVKRLAFPELMVEIELRRRNELRVRAA